MTPALPEPLVAAARTLRSTPLATLFERDRDRARRLTLAWNDWRIDLSRERLTPEVLGGLADHARASGLRRWIEAMFAGEKVNVSESRAVLHPALRDPGRSPLSVDGTDARAALRGARDRSAAWAARIHDGAARGATGAPIRHVLHLGIGGSDLGPRLVVDALRRPGAPGPGVTFVANVDPAALARALAPLDAASTLVVIASKSFGTQETMENAKAVIRWLDAALPGTRPAACQVLAATARPDLARACGLPEDAILPMHDGVGGRFSLWSSVGVTIAAVLGREAHLALLDGAHAMDRHFRETPFETNLPVALALAGLWNASALEHRQRIVVPYAEALALLPAYLQQLSLESNGKRVTRDGEPVAGRTAPALWGGVGTDGQHAFFQWLHQGTDQVPVEFIVPALPAGDDRDRHALLVANALAQAQALALGRPAAAIEAELASTGLSGAALARAAAVRACPGDRPSTTILVPRIDAATLGALLALYEHRNFVEGILWGVNPFDQFGVELGKILAAPIAGALAGGRPLPADCDPSTRALVDHVAALMRR